MGREDGRMSKGPEDIKTWAVVLTMLAAVLGLLSLVLMWIWEDFGWLGLTIALAMAAIGMWRAERDVAEEKD
jgi:hypothetical protein